jgi:hypothetical protein
MYLGKPQYYIIFSATDENSAAEFELFFHPQSQQSGFLVDIILLVRSLAKGSPFLHMDGQNLICVNSLTAPDDKFLIVPEG